MTQAEVSSDGTADPDEQAEGAPATAEADHQEEAAAAEGVEIPKQQSAEEAADNEAGESARK
ncbi:gliding motility protein [Streptomyces sp. NPDC016309]|uniref:gliding motility protein n=1 Tax=Streptomyces sp. NPDC016309 TaxID=3364965 RepID=UPI0036F4EBFE